MSLKLPYATLNDEYPDAFWRIDQVTITLHPNNPCAVIRLIGYKSKTLMAAGNPPITETTVCLTSEESASLLGKLNLRKELRSAIKAHVPTEGHMPTIAKELDFRTSVEDA